MSRPLYAERDRKRAMRFQAGEKWRNLPRNYRQAILKARAVEPWTVNRLAAIAGDFEVVATEESMTW